MTKKKKKGRMCSNNNLLLSLSIVSPSFVVVVGFGEIELHVQIQCKRRLIFGVRWEFERVIGLFNQYVH